MHRRAPHSLENAPVILWRLSLIFCSQFEPQNNREEETFERKCHTTALCEAHACQVPFRATTFREPHLVKAQPSEALCPACLLFKQVAKVNRTSE